MMIRADLQRRGLGHQLLTALLDRRRQPGGWVTLIASAEGVGLYRRFGFRVAVPMPDLRNLEVYHEIGLGLDIENIETLDNDAYAALYREKLAEWHEVYPILPDNRLWRDGAPRVEALGDKRAVA